MSEKIRDIQVVYPTELILKIPFLIMGSRGGLNMICNTPATSNICYLIDIFPYVNSLLPMLNYFLMHKRIV